MSESTKVRAIGSARREPDPEIVGMLETALDRAKKGELVDCVLIYTDSGDYGYDCKVNSDCYAIAGYMGKVRREIEEAAEGDD